MLVRDQAWQRQRVSSTEALSTGPRKGKPGLLNLTLDIIVIIVIPFSQFSSATIKILIFIQKGIGLFSERGCRRFHPQDWIWAHGSKVLHYGNLDLIVQHRTIQNQKCFKILLKLVACNVRLNVTFREFLNNVVPSNTLVGDQFRDKVCWFCLSHKTKKPSGHRSQNISFRDQFKFCCAMKNVIPAVLVESSIRQKWVLPWPPLWYEMIWHHRIAEKMFGK